MTKEKDSSNHTSNQNGQWEMTGELREKIRNANQELETMRKEFENKIIDCPTCSSPSKFVKYKGGYTRVRGLFRCTKGHEFFEG